MSVLRDGLQVDVLVELHVLRVDPDHLQPPGLIRHADVNLTVKPPESASGARRVSGYP
jgi:hypothetical protein